jgi:hypothetical protein
MPDSTATGLRRASTLLVPHGQADASNGEPVCWRRRENTPGKRCFPVVASPPFKSIHHRRIFGFEFIGFGQTARSHLDSMVCR